MRIGTATRNIIFAALSPFHFLAIKATLRRQVSLNADDRIYPSGFGLLIKVISPEDIPMISHGQGRHPHSGARLKKLSQPGRPIEHGVFGVDVEVSKRGHD